MVYISKLNRAQSKAIDNAGSAQQAKEYLKKNPKPLAPIYRDMQKETDKIKWRHRRELKLDM